jgi:hypothetical protein
MATLTTPSGTRPLDAFYGIYFEPSETGGVDVDLVVMFADRAFQCSVDAGEVDAISFLFARLGATRSSSQVLSRAGIFAQSIGGTGEVDLTSVDDRFMGNDQNGPIVGAGGRVDGSVHFDLGGGVILDGKFQAPHCALIDFRNAV